MFRIKSFCVSFFVVFFHTIITFSQNPDTTLVYHWVKVLASDSLEGRLTGSLAEKKASTFLYHEFQSMGLIGQQLGGIQEFDVITGLKLGEMNYMCNGSCPGEIGIDYIPASFSASADVEAECVDAGYGYHLNLDTLKRDDYEGLNIKGKIVIIRKGVPDNAPDWIREHASDREKVMMATDLGAAGVIIILPSDIKLPELHYDKVGTAVSIPVMYVSQEHGQCLVKSMKQHDLRMSVALEPVIAKAKNVWGVLVGSDTVLKDEYIVIGAHYDHLGWGGAGSGSRIPDTVAIHFGADDNASGVAGLGAVAQYFLKNNFQPRRSLLFVCFSGEEMGLIGSSAFMENTPVPREKIVSMINFDMIGRLNRKTLAVSIGGTGTSAEGQAILDSLLALMPLKATFSPEGFGPSDHASFYSRNIPVFYFNSGIHTDYHTPFDSPEKINFSGLVSISEAGARLALSLANRSHSLTFREAGPKTRISGRQGLKVTLGIMPDFTAGDIQGLRVAGVTPGGPASRAGMQKGDIITALDGKAVNDIYEYMNRLKSLQKGKRVNVDVKRGTEDVVLIVEL